MSSMRRAVYDAYTIAVLAVVASLFYREMVISYIRTLTVPSYSYLMVLAPVTLLVLSDITYRRSIIGKLDMFTLTSALGGVFVSISLLILANLITEYSLQLETLSIIVFLGFIILLVYGEFNDAKTPITIWILLLMLVPMPRMWIDFLASQFSHPIAWLSAYIAGGRVAESQGYIFILIRDVAGSMRRFYITPECSGVISFLSILSLAPVVAYLASKSDAGLKKTVMVTLAALFIGALVAVTGNLIRIILVLYVTKHHSYTLAMKLFHQTPSLIYSGIAAAITVYIPLRLTPLPGKRELAVKPINTKLFDGSDIAKILSIIALVAVFVYLGTSMVPLAGMHGSTLVNPETLIKTPEEIVFNTTRLNVSYHYQSRPIIGEALGALTVHSLSLRVGSTYMSGWIEVAETPGRFHSWVVCLSGQGYRIEKWWSETVNGTTINYAVIRKGIQKMILAYTVLKYPTSMGDLYVKISLFAPATDATYKAKAESLTNILLKIGESHYTPAGASWFMLLLYTGLIIISASSISGVVYKATRRKES